MLPNVIPFPLKRGNTQNHHLYIMGGCYHDFREEAPFYYFKLGRALCPEDRASHLGMKLLATIWWASDWEHPYHTALHETLGGNSKARYWGKASSECYGKFDTWEDLLAYTSDLATEIAEQVEAGRYRANIPIPKCK